jgi:hypothetical protein
MKREIQDCILLIEQCVRKLPGQVRTLRVASEDSLYEPCYMISLVNGLDTLDASVFYDGRIELIKVLSDKMSEIYLDITTSEMNEIELEVVKFCSRE